MNKRRGLIVDDDTDLANFLRIVLGLAGFECETAQSPKAALNYLATNEPDLIFLDLNLGADIQGSDLLYHIRSNPRFDNTRVIIITGYPGWPNRSPPWRTWYCSSRWRSTSSQSWPRAC
jgi:DNA-binding response OmpR family regulator